MTTPATVVVQYPITVLLAQFMMPAVNGSATASVGTTQWMVPGQGIVVAGLGTLIVTSILDATDVVLENTGATGNAMSGTVALAGASVGVAGTPGPPGVPITWADDLASSTNTNQYASGISGSGGTGGTISVGDGLHAVTLVQSGTVALTLESGGTLELESAGALVLKGAGQPNFVLNAQATNTTFSGGTSSPSSFFLENNIFSLYVGGSPIATATTIGWGWATSFVTLAASGTTTLTTAQQATPLLIMGVVTLTANVTLALNGVAGAFYLDFSAVTLSGHTLTVTNGSGSATVSSGTLVIASCVTTNLISLTPSTVPNPIVADSSVTLATSGTTTLSAAQLITPSLTIATVSLTGNATLAFGSATVGGLEGTSSAVFDLDCSAVTLSGHTLTLSNGTATFNATTLLGTKTLLRVKCQTNTIVIG